MPIVCISIVSSINRSNSADVNILCDIESRILQSSFRATTSGGHGYKDFDFIFTFPIKKDKFPSQSDVDISYLYDNNR